MNDIDLVYLDGAETMVLLKEIQAVYHAAFPNYDLDDPARRTSRQAAVPGFAAVCAKRDDDLVGVVYGLPLTQDTGWWNGLMPVAGTAFAAEPAPAPLRLSTWLSCPHSKARASAGA